MANNRSSNHPIPADFSSVLHENFKKLNSLSDFDTSFLDEEKDWYLLCFLREQLRNGHTMELTFAALNAIIGTLSGNSYYHNPINNNIGFLNQNHHLIGESGTYNLERALCICTLIIVMFRIALSHI
jgi:hypothetical protein